MTTLRLDENNNLIVGENFLTLSGIEALIQDVRTRLKMFLGEYPFDTSNGVDYVGLFQNNDKKEIENAIIAEIKKDKRVSQVIIENLDFTNGKLTLNIKVINGEGESAYV